MKIVALGDTHGRMNWKEIVNKNNFDKIIFIGDYFDSRENISSARQKKNFKEILSFKKGNKDKVILLIGNHDFHYLEITGDTYSGYQPRQQSAFCELLQPAVDEGLLQMCFKYNNLLFSHAGLTKTWCNMHQVQVTSIEESVNTLFKQKPEAFEFALGRTNNSSGDDPEQSPIWVRPTSLLEDRLDTYIQVVGHTVHQQLNISDKAIFIDTLGTTGEYLVYEDGKFLVGDAMK